MIVVVSHANCTHPRTPAGRAACRRGATHATDATPQNEHLSVVAERTRELMNQHGLTDWRFSFDNSRRRFGYCRYAPVRVIQISRPLAEVNEWSVIRKTVLHEIAHALAGHAAGHGPVWQAMALEIGASPARCYDTTEVVRPAGMWIATCGNCGATCARTRKPKNALACKQCCGRYNGGRFDTQFQFTFRKND